MDIPVDSGGAPEVTLGGRKWPVPVLAARQNRIIDPLILSLLPLFDAWSSDRAGAIAKIDAARYDALQEIAFQGVKRAHPELSREQFLDLPVTLPELIASFAVIAQQTGVFEKAAPGRALLGEAGAGSSPPRPTGTPSSPMSAT